MAPENAAAVRDLFRAFDEGDYARALGLFDPDVEWRPTEGAYRGLEGVASHLAEWLEPWDEHRIEAERISERAGAVLAEIRLTARGGHSGMEIDQRFFQVYRLRGGRIVRMDEYLDRAEALAALDAGQPGTR